MLTSFQDRGLLTFLVWAGLKYDPPISTFQAAGITGMSQNTQELLSPEMLNSLHF
jgi:hypothetical protein